MLCNRDVTEEVSHILHYISLPSPLLLSDCSNDIQHFMDSAPAHICHITHVNNTREARATQEIEFCSQLISLIQHEERTGSGHWPDTEEWCQPDSQALQSLQDLPNKSSTTDESEIFLEREASPLEYFTIFSKEISDRYIRLVLLVKL